MLDTEAMRIVLLGDLHLYQLSIGLRSWFGKRLLGQTNLLLNRRHHFAMDRLPGLIERARALEPDMVICTGDFTTTGLKDEFTAAAKLLAPLFAGREVAIVPGNHDRYTRGAARTRAFEQAFADYAPSSYPHRQQIGVGLHLIALDPTRPNLINASGSLGAGQLAGLREMLEELPADHQLIVVCHYPIGTPPDYPDESRSHGLVESGELFNLLSGSGREVLYLHGHIHQPWCWEPEGAEGLTIVNAGAPVYCTPDYPDGQGFWEIEVVPEQDPPWRAIHHAGE